jgi:hypothetical protein
MSVLPGNFFRGSGDEHYVVQVGIAPPALTDLVIRAEHYQQPARQPSSKSAKKSVLGNGQKQDPVVFRKTT